MELKFGKCVLNGKHIVYVDEDASGYYFTKSSDGSGEKIRVSRYIGYWAYADSEPKRMYSAQFSDPPLNRGVCMMMLKVGRQVLDGGAFVHVDKDRDGYYFTIASDGSGIRIRLRYEKGMWKYSLPGAATNMVAVFSDPPKKPC